MTLLMFMVGCAEKPVEEPPPPVVEVVRAPLVGQAPPTANLPTYQEMWSDKNAERSALDGQGKVEWVEAPQRMVAGSKQRLQLRYTAGPGIEAGGSVVFLPEPFWGWSPVQIDRPDQPGFVDVSRKVPAKQEVLGQMLSVSLPEGLPAGESLVFTFEAVIDRFAGADAALWVGVDGDGDGLRGPVLPDATLQVSAHEFAQLHAVMPSVSEPGKTVQITVASLDMVGNWAQEDHTLEMTYPAGLSGPTRVNLEGGTAKVPVDVTRPGIFHVVARSIDDGRILARTNPMVSRAGAVPVLWGDVQIHSGWSDGTARPDEIYRYAQHVAGLDVAAVTDHDHWGRRFLDQDDERWDGLQHIANSAYKPGSFVTFVGYEWTSWVYGHRHVLYPGNIAPLFSSLDEAYDTPGELISAVKPHEGLVIPHHPAGGPVAVSLDPSLDPAGEPLLEIVSVHGQCESMGVPGAIYNAQPGHFAHDRLASGERFGFLGSTDGHDGHPGLSQFAGPSGGLVGIVGAEPNRASVMAALKNKQTYATNGSRILLRFALSGATMGQDVLNSPDPAEAVVRVVGTAVVRQVDLVGQEGVLASVMGERETLFHTFAVPELSAGDFYYVRVLQDDGGMAWSSPVFVR